jgi:U6 snRNA phosphodiesterase
VLRINPPGTNGLNKLLHVSNKVVQEHGQRPLYTRPADEKISNRESELVRSNSTPARGEPSVEWHGMQDASDAFHISIAWALEPPSNHMLDATRSLAMDQLEEVKKALLKVADIKAKVGNVVTSIRLQRTVMEGKSMFGL